MTDTNLVKDLTASLQEAIAKNLPGAVADELQTFIKEAKRTAEKLETSNRINTQQGERILELEAKIQTQEQLYQREQDVERKNKDADAKLEEARVKQIELRAVLAEEKFTVLNSAFSLVFKNTVLREHVMATVPVAVDSTPPTEYNRGGNPAYVATHPSTTDKRIETE